MPPLKGLSRFLVTFSLSLATFLIVLDYSIANVSIPYISGDLAVSTDQGTYVITSFAVGNSIALPITGWLTKRVGGVKLICLSLLLFVLFSWTCGMSRNIVFLVVSRFLQGFVSGPLVPLSQTLLILSNPPEKKRFALSTWSTVVVAAPILGPILGGWISYDFYWPWIFYINIPIGLFCAIVIWSLLRKRETEKESQPVDWIGLLLLAIGVCCLQIFLDKGEQFDWLRSNIMRTLITTSVISFTFLIVWSIFSPKPLIEMKLFKIRTYALSVFFIFVSYGIYFGSVVLIPLWLQTDMGYTSTWAGLAVAPIGLPPLLFTIIAGKLLNRFGPTVPLGIAFIFFSISCFYTAYLNTNVDIWSIGYSRLLLGFAVVFWVSIFTLFLQDVSGPQLASATGIFHFFRAMSGAVGTAVFTTMWTRRSAYHHAVVGENLTAYSRQTEGYLDKLDQVGLSGEQGLAQLNVALNHQADVLAINDCFYFMGWVFLAILLFLPFGISRKKRDGSQPSHQVSVGE